MPGLLIFTPYSSILKAIVDSSFFIESWSGTSMLSRSIINRMSVCFFVFVIYCFNIADIVVGMHEESHVQNVEYNSSIKVEELRDQSSVIEEEKLKRASLEVSERLFQAGSITEREEHLIDSDMDKALDDLSYYKREVLPSGIVLKVTGASYINPFYYLLSKHWNNVLARIKNSTINKHHFEIVMSLLPETLDYAKSVAESYHMEIEELEEDEELLSCWNSMADLGYELSKCPMIDLCQTKKENIESVAYYLGRVLCVQHRYES